VFVDEEVCDGIGEGDIVTKGVNDVNGEDV